MKRFRIAQFVGIILLGASVSTLAAREEEPTISVRAEVDKAFVTIGERIEYRVTITRSPSVEILSKALAPPSEVFEVKEVHDFSEKQGKVVVEGRRFILTTYEIGEFTLDPVRIQYRTGEGQEKTMETHRLFITVRSIDPSGKPKTDIRGAKGVLEFPREWRWLLGLLLIALIVGGGGFFWWQEKHRPLAGEKEKEVLLSPEDEALLRLSRLFDSDLLRRGKLKEYFLELSEILRVYFERRYEISAVESTTSEILRDLRAKEVPQTLQMKIRQLFETADLVKFAKWRPDPPEIIRVNQLAKVIVEEGRLRAPVSEPGVETPNHGV